MTSIESRVSSFRRGVRWMPLLALLAAVLAWAGCSEGVKIADINNDPARYANKNVTIYGEVVNSLGALTEGLYEVDDGTGRIWVLAHGGGVPAKGARVRVSGRVNTGVTVGPRSYGTILRESSRKTEKVG